MGEDSYVLVKDRDAETRSTGSVSTTSTGLMSNNGFDNGNLMIGVLALQGAFREHVQMLRKIQGVKPVLVKLPEDLKDLQGLIIPGGESTAISSLAERWKMTEPLKKWVADGRPTWGTCAGMILLSREVTGKMKEGQMVLGGLETTVHRNFFGSQLGSFVAPLNIKMSSSCGRPEVPYKGVFIRAPVIVERSDNVKVLATVCRPTAGSSEAAGSGNDEVVVAVRQHNLLATSFHPELTQDTRWHEVFVEMVEEARKV